MSHKRHKTIVRTKKFAVEVCKEPRSDFVVVRLCSSDRHTVVHHHLHPNEALRLAHGILNAIEFLPR